MYVSEEQEITNDNPQAFCEFLNFLCHKVVDTIFLVVLNCQITVFLYCLSNVSPHTYAKPCINRKTMFSILFHFSKWQHRRSLKKYCASSKRILVCLHGRFVINYYHNEFVIQTQYHL